MSESNNLPQAISHKKLTYLMLNAQKDLNASDDKKNTESLEKQEFDELINNWVWVLRPVTSHIKMSSHDNTVDFTFVIYFVLNSRPHPPTPRI